MTNEIKGFTVEIYRDQYNSELNVLNDRQRATVISSALPAMFTPTEEEPAIILKTRTINGKQYTHAEPAEPGFYAFGGSFVWSSDSRFRELSEQPIALHDRNMTFETKPVKSVTVHFSDGSKDYTTSVSIQTTPEDARAYFVGKYFDMGQYPNENMLQCIGITYRNEMKKQEIKFEL